MYKVTPNELLASAKSHLGAITDISMKVPAQCSAEVKKVNWKVLLGKEHGKKTSHHSINPWSDCIFSVVYSSSLHFKNITADITHTKIDWGGVCVFRLEKRKLKSVKYDRCL